MNPDKIITSDMLYTTDLFSCGFGNFNYRCAGNLNKAARRTHQFPYFADFLKMSPTKILGMSGVGSVTYNAFIDFLVEYPHLMNIPGFSYNPELKNLVMSKVTAKNNKTITNNYTDATLVKQEIDSKQINSTTFVAEYTIKVTNNGNVPGYVKKIADYLPKDFQFNSELNKDWYQSGNTLYCTSLSNVAIKPGESKEVKLILVKKMNENNTGLFNNSAEIVESYNEYGLKDINSVEGNKVKGEDDMGSADLIISIKTGQIVLTAVFTVIAVTALAVISIITYRKLNGRI